MGHVSGKDNIGDIDTKPLSPSDYYRLLRPPLYGKFDDTKQPSAQVRGSCAMELATSPNTNPIARGITRDLSFPVNSDPEDMDDSYDVDCEPKILKDA